MKVEVTRKHIDDAKGNIIRCPIDLAIEELLNVQNVITGIEAVHFDYKGEMLHIDLPEDARTWILHHDANTTKLQNVHPITFELAFEYV